MTSESLPDGQRLNVVTLREYVEAKLEAIAMATRLSHDAIGVRLDGMNEFRESLRDQTARYISRAEHDALCRQINALENWRSQQEGKASQSSVFVAFVLSVIGVGIGAMGLILALLRG